MARGFRRSRKGYETTLAPAESDLLRGVAASVLALMEQPQPKDDPAMRRLFPDGYRDDPKAAAELRALIEDDLVAGKRRAANTVLASLPAAGGKVVLDESRAEQWLGLLNDARLTLGTRLDVTESPDEEMAALAEDDPRLASLAVFHWLGWLQETLVAALSR